ncbi:MAG: hypothetical protein V1740_02130 [Candidatus Woesearchaeota archaeon]
MDDETFKHHVNKEKNDFSEWIRVVFKDEELANAVKKTASRNIIAKLIEEKIKNIKKLEKKEVNKKEKKEATKPQIKEGKDVIKEETTRQDITQKKIDEILQKEREIEKREESIEKILEKTKIDRSTKFFSKEFVQGIIVGLLLAVICALIYLKFFAA